MNIVILGASGYLGWVNLMHFAKQEHNVIGVDSRLKQVMMVKENVTALEIEQDIFDRFQTVNRLLDSNIEFLENDICGDGILKAILEKHEPDVIINFSEQPSAPFSMSSESNALGTISNNVMGTLRLIYAVKEINPDIHIIKLGTMGEYGAPNIDIEEGWLDVNHNGRTDRMLFPKSPHSIYHLSKVHDSDALAFACRVWGLKVTDLNQGFVYGMHTPETDITGLYPRFCYDSIFGTVLNRFIVQAVCGHPLTIYGTGGQTRPMININDTIKCIQLAVDNPASQGEFRVFNQYTETMSINTMAEIVGMATPVTIQNLVNPRIESEDHYYNPKNSAISQLGLKPDLLTHYQLNRMLDWVEERKQFINEDLIMPSVRW